MNYKHLRMIRSSNDWLLWRGEHPASGDRYLIKQPQSTADGARLAARLSDEYAFLQPLQHTHLIRPRHWDPTTPCIVFEDVQGSLAQLLEQEGRLTPVAVLNLMIQCLDALAYLHERQLGHGCVSTHTILVDPSGSIKLGDFIGYRFNEGTPPPPDQPMKYQAPEMLDCTLGICGPHSDLYCLGHTALESLLGEEYPMLFAGPGCSAADVQANWLGWHAHPGRELTDLTQALPQVPPAFVDILTRIIRKSPMQRGYRSAAEMRQALLATGLASPQPLPELSDGRSAPAPAEVAQAEEQPAKKPRSASRGRPISLKWMHEGESKVRKFHPRQTVLVGCSPSCELELDRVGVSRRHALLTCQANGQWWIYDLHSSQGTWRNGTSIRAAALRAGDELRFGSVRCWVGFGSSRKGDWRVGPFKVKRLFHQGRHGTLYQASWPDNPSHPIVALRVFPPEFQFNAEQIRRFLRAIPQAAMFRHPNLLRLFRGGSVRNGTKRVWYIAMEHMAGGSLRDRIARSGGITGAETFRFAHEVLQGLRAIAGQGLMHRNLTPSCILFDEEGHVKIGDFVLMRGDQLDSFQQITRAGALPAEHVYQAPELVQGVSEIGPSCDLYSLAAVMYEALTGQPPIPTNSKLPELIDAICHRPVAPPCSLNPSLPPEMDAFLLRALAKEPQRRFQTADEFEQGMRVVENTLHR